MFSQTLDNRTIFAAGEQLISGNMAFGRAAFNPGVVLAVHKKREEAAS